MNSDQIEGKFKKAKGAVKEKTGALLGDRELEGEGASVTARPHAQHGM